MCLKRIDETIKKFHERVFQRLDTSVSDDDKITTIDIIEFAIHLDGANILARLIDKDIIRDTEYDKVEVYYDYPYVILGFIYEEFGHEQIQFAKVEPRVFSKRFKEYIVKESDRDLTHYDDLTQ